MKIWSRNSKEVLEMETGDLEWKGGTRDRKEEIDRRGQGWKEEIETVRRARNGKKGQEQKGVARNRKMGFTQKEGLEMEKKARNGKAGQE